jgi:hypothetical protein
MHPVRVDSLVLHDSAVKGTVEPMEKRRSGAFFAGCCAPVEAFRITSVSGHATPQFPNLIAGSLTRRLKPISRDLLRTASILTFHIVKSFDTFYFPLTLLIFTINRENVPKLSF